MIDGIPCIVLDDDIISSEKEIRQKSGGYVGPEDFTGYQQSKERRYYKNVLEELKRKFREV